MALTPNPERARLRYLINKIRKADQDIRKYIELKKFRNEPVSKVLLIKRKRMKYQERELSYLLRQEAPLLNDKGIPVWQKGSFQNFKHSSRFKNWVKIGGRW